MGGDLREDHVGEDLFTEATTAAPVSSQELSMPKMRASGIPPILFEVVADMANGRQHAVGFPALRERGTGLLCADAYATFCSAGAPTGT